MTLLAIVWIPKASEIDPASLLSLTPNNTFSFFLTNGKFSLKKLVSSSVTFPWATLNALFKVIEAASKGK